MANAGRVSVVPKGNWQADIKYSRLDFVKYSSALYLAKKDVPLGTLPTDTDYWMFCGETDISEVSNAINNIIDGTTTVGKAWKDSDGNFINTTYAKGVDLTDHIDASVTDEDGVHGFKVSSDKKIYARIDGEWAEITGGSNPNLLMNPDFRINQRGQSEIVIDKSHVSKYFVDRWKVDGGTSVMQASVIQNSNGGITTSITTTDSAKIAMHQYFEDEYFQQFRGKQLILSIKISDMIIQNPQALTSCVFLWGKVDGTERQLNGQLSLSNLGNGIHTKIFNIPDAELTDVHLIIYPLDGRYGATTGDTITIDWVKLEVGSIATEFVPPDPASELLKCQRYCVDMTYFSEVLTSNVNSNVIYACFPIPTNMRITNVSYIGDVLIGESEVSAKDNGFSIIANVGSGSLRLALSKTNHGYTSPLRISIPAGTILEAEL